MSDYETTRNAAVVALVLSTLASASLLLALSVAKERWRWRRLMWRFHTENSLHDAAMRMVCRPLPDTEPACRAELLRRAEDWERWVRVRAPALVLLLALLPAIARADPPPCVESRPGYRECSVERLAAIQATEAALWDALAQDRAALAVAREEAATERARADRLERELAAERDAAALRVCPQVDVVPWAIAGAGVGAAIVAVLALLMGGR